MDDIQFWYPATHDPDDINAIQNSGTIRIINIRQEPYELVISSNGCSFHIIFGRYANGNFLCIPDWEVGCELGSYRDRLWNISSMAESGFLSYLDACAIANALALMDFLLGKDIRD